MQRRQSSMETPGTPGGYRSLVESQHNRIRQLEMEMDEFRTSSREYEIELEDELRVAQENSSVLEDKLERMNNQLHESTKMVKENSRTVSALQTENEELKRKLGKLRERKIVLEQDNDDLERRNRELAASLVGIKDTLDKTLERVSFLEEELEVSLTVRTEMEEKERDEQQMNQSKMEVRRMSLISMIPTDFQQVMSAEEILENLERLTDRLNKCEELCENIKEG